MVSKSSNETCLKKSIYSISWIKMKKMKKNNYDLLLKNEKKNKKKNC